MRAQLRYRQKVGLQAHIGNIMSGAEAPAPKPLSVNSGNK